MTQFAAARKLADAVLYEGYVLYPYRSTARKNHVRWQFGVIAPRDWCDAGGCEYPFTRTECLVEPGEHAHLTGLLRFLQLQERRVEDREGRSVPLLEVDDEIWMAWDEGVEREVPFAVDLADGKRAVVPFTLPGGAEPEVLRSRGGREVGRFVRVRQPIAGEIRIAVDAVDAMSPLLKLSIHVENVTRCSLSTEERDPALRQSMVGAHSLLAVQDGAFLSLTEPPEWASAPAKTCQNVRSWPILVSEVVLASPIILADHARIADESPGDLYDATEIDEILTLRTMTLTDAEKREARATDPRAAAIIDRVDGMPPEMLDKLHGALRSLREIERPAEKQEKPAWWDPGADASVSPDTDTVDVRGVSVARGAHVRLQPGTRRADAHDMFLAGKLATVQAVYTDVEEQRYLAVTLDDDPGADLAVRQGRFYYFYPDEVEPT
jgi:hypothetical protein